MDRPFRLICRVINNDFRQLCYTNKQRLKVPKLKASEVQGLFLWFLFAVTDQSHPRWSSRSLKYSVPLKIKPAGTKTFCGSGCEIFVLLHCWCSKFRTRCIQRITDDYHIIWRVLTEPKPHPVICFQLRTRTYWTRTTPPGSQRYRTLRKYVQ